MFPMAPSYKPTATVDDVFFLLQKLYEKVDGHDKRFEAIDQRFEAIDQRFEAIDQRFETMERKIDNLTTITTNAVGDIAKIQEELEVLAYHSTQHFDTDEKQDKRIARVEEHLHLPALVL